MGIKAAMVVTLVSAPDVGKDEDDEKTEVTLSFLQQEQEFSRR
jgi:hypothetical protein